MKVELLLWVVSLVHCVDWCFSARILVMFPFPGKSHHIMATSIMKALAQRGHHIVEYSPYPPKSAIPNHTHVEVHTKLEQAMDKMTYAEFLNHPTKYERDFYGYKIRTIWEINHGLCEDTFNNERIQQLIKSESKFDLVITESTFGQESFLGFGHRFSAPTVSLETFVPWCQLNWISGNTLSLASVPDLFSVVTDSDVLSFKERVVNAVSILLTIFNYHNSHLPFHDQLVKKYFPYPDMPSVSDMVYNVSLYLTNSYPHVVNYIQPHTPNIVPVGGLHIPSETVPLPQDIKSFLDSANEGFIYFSFGTIVPTHIFPEHVIQIFLNVFKKLPQKVLWKINMANIDKIPKNVMITKWVPQVGVLGHPNCKLFITHGGLFSHHEAMHAGVPTIGIPFFGDQPYNSQYNQRRGKGLKLDFTTLDEYTLYSAVTTVLNNKRFKETAAQMSRIYRDRPLSPLDTAVFWVEYVLRHGGARHLRPASSQMSWYQLALLDVLAVILTVTAVLVTTLYILIKRLLGKRPKKTTPGKKKN